MGVRQTPYRCLDQTDRWRVVRACDPGASIGDRTARHGVVVVVGDKAVVGHAAILPSDPLGHPTRSGRLVVCVSSLTDCLVERDSATADLGQDGFCGGGPDEGLGLVVMDLHVFLDRGDQVRDGVEYASA